MENALDKLLSGCLKKDRRAQKGLYEFCFGPMMSICVRYKKQRDDAVSLVNESFLKVLLSLEHYDRKRPFLTWVSAIAVRTAIDDYRKNLKYRQTVELNDDCSNLHTHESGFSENGIWEKLSAENVKEILFQLPEDERIVFNLFALEGYLHHEIAELLNVSERTSKRLLQRAKKKLKLWFENQGMYKDAL